MAYSSIPSGVEAIFLFASDISEPENYNRFDLLMVQVSLLLVLSPTPIELMLLALLDYMAKITWHLNMICSKT